jgi:DNA-binding transcriptional LysR family regulator
MTQMTAIESAAGIVTDEPETAGGGTTERRHRGISLGSLELIQLRVLDAMWRERGVRRAGERLFLTPSAISHNLARMRDLLGDELFIRRASGMQPTPRMIQLAPKVQSIIRELEQILNAGPFCPDTSPRRFTIAALPSIATLVLPQALGVIRQMAPEMRFLVVPLNQNLAADLEGRQVDIAIGSFGRLPSSFQRMPVYRDEFVLALARDHPALSVGAQRIDLSSLGYVDIEPINDGNEFPRAYCSFGGLERRVALTTDEMTRLGFDMPVVAIVPDTNTALAFIHRSKLAGVVLGSAARHYNQNGSLTIIDLPPPAPPLPIEMIYDRSSEIDLATVWLLDSLKLAMAEAHTALVAASPPPCANYKVIDNPPSIVRMLPVT